MIAHRDGFDGLDCTPQNADAGNQRTRPVRLNAMAAWDTNQESPAASSFQKMFNDVKWEQTHFGPRDGWEPELSQSE
jgi:hypothetical protein